jgi:hypothetical protein
MIGGVIGIRTVDPVVKHEPYFPRLFTPARQGALAWMEAVRKEPSRLTPPKIVLDEYIFMILLRKIIKMYSSIILNRRRRRRTNGETAPAKGARLAASFF